MYEEILNEIPSESRARLTPTRLGMVLKSLKVRTMRVWEGTGEGRRRVTVAVLAETDDADESGVEEQDDDGKASASSTSH
jgi:hypothetical protein